MQYIITQQALTVYQAGQVPLTLHADDSRWNAALDAIRDNDEEKLIDLITPAAQLNKVLSGGLKIQDGVLFYKDQALPGESYLVKRIFEMVEADLPVAAMGPFIGNLLENPSYRAVNELLQFVEYGKMPITPDGCFLAYKKIREDWTDIYTGKYNNAIGRVVTMPRNMVDEDSNRTCSAGLHVCSYEYLGNFGWGQGNRVVVVKVNPRDVVAVPTDYNNTKMRVCRYEVIDELEELRDTLRDTLLNDYGAETIVDEFGEQDMFPVEVGYRIVHRTGLMVWNHDDGCWVHIDDTTVSPDEVDFDDVGDAEFELDRYVFDHEDATIEEVER